MKYDLGQRLFFMANNKVCSQEVSSRAIIDNAKDSLASTEAQIMTWTPFGKSGEYYSFPSFGVMPVDKVFASKEELLASL
jgi:hypothetical protein